MDFETKLAIGAGVAIGAFGVAFGIAAFMKKMTDEGYPEIAKFPVKAIDELCQRSQSPEYEKAAVTVMAKATESLIDEYDNQNKQWHLQRSRWY